MAQSQLIHKEIVHKLQKRIIPIFLTLIVVGTLLILSSSELLRDNIYNYNERIEVYFEKSESVTAVSNIEIEDFKYNNQQNDKDPNIITDIEMNIAQTNTTITNTSSNFVNSPNDFNDAGRWSSTDLTSETNMVSTHRQLTRSAIEYISKYYKQGLDGLIEIPQPMDGMVS